jgi:flavin-dependent dehydrogenase
MKLPNNTEKVAIIVGAGPGGLTVAYELKKRTNIRPLYLKKLTVSVVYLRLRLTKVTGLI